ncbi:hypothetical protein PanWU01x14_027850 [Parasponia andersonii]|uniref:Uncharacterized protein n=1 Tax=Parasponia andersonii TaxID=3476 RepID=A0A2P5DV44_PARAD|nr:hypothetical protein PanWU01x14_027850 [Parasponia andersonii]
MKYPSLYGSSTLAQGRKREGLSIIDSFQRNYFSRSTKKWVNKAAELAYTKMSELCATQMEAHATSSGEFDIEENPVQSAPPRIDETLIAAEALGVRRGHRTGIGRVLRGEMNDTQRQLDELRALVLWIIPAARPSSSSNQPDQDDEDEYLDDD